MSAKTRGLGGSATAQAFSRRTAPVTPDETDAAPAPGTPTSTTGGIVAALRRPTPGADSAPGAPAQVALTDLAPHPDNLRTDLGDLRGLAASIREFGVLQPLVVVPAAAFLAAAPQHAEAVSGRPWVVVAGHRRRAASAEAGRTEVPVVVREDLHAPDTAVVTFVAENVHREPLTPLDEARGYSLLSDLGAGQREIARRCGVSQSHVSKRLQLLKLPQAAQDALAAGEMPIGEALDLAALPDEDQPDVWDIVRMREVPVAVAAGTWARQKAERHAVEQAEAKAKSEKVQLVDAHEEWGPDSHRHRLDSAKERQRAKKDGTLRAAATGSGLVYYTTTPASTSSRASSHEQAEAEEAKQRRTAMRARADACARLVAKAPPAAQRTSDLVQLVLHGRLEYAACLRLVHDWLGDRYGTPGDPYRWRDTLADNPDATAHVAWAMTIAAAEVHARWTHSPWDSRDAAHLDRLRDLAGYTPTAWETARLEAARTRGDSTESPPGEPIDLTGDSTESLDLDALQEAAS
jgi:ParB/RepB/Spo0J family partition protein